MELSTVSETKNERCVLIMDMRKFNAYGRGGIAQYSQPQIYELAGKKFEFVMDDGIDYTLSFIDKETVEWNFEGQAPQRASGYLCNKADDTTYLVSYELANTEKRSNHTWVIDLENQLVTRIISVIGENPKLPYLIVPKYEFGAIKSDGADVPVYPRHGFTIDLVGTAVEWAYGGMTTVHLYNHTNTYRITYPSEMAASASFNETLSKLPSPDEPANFIKIKEGVYLFNLVESNAERVLKGNGFIFRSNSMAFLQNYKRVFTIGRAFGTTTPDGKENHLHLTFAAFGKLIDVEGDKRIAGLMDEPNPYVV